MSQDCKKKTDAELVVLSLQEKEYFLCIIQKYQPALSRYIRRISGGTHEDIEDLLQEIFIKVYIHLTSYDSKQSFSSWIYRIARNETISTFRKKKIRPKSVYLEPEELEHIAGTFDFIQMKEKEEFGKEIQNILSLLDPKYRDVLVLKYLEEKEYQEIADILHKPIGTVGTLINRAKKQFQKKYKVI
ncbi:MAG: RNA polymerase sigma factor [Candidatus Magasanikbacteria bacterium]